MAGKRPRQQIETVAETSQHQVEEKINVAINAKMLECFACSGPLTPPLFQCTEGHVLCSECCADGYVEDDEVECLECRDPETVNSCRVMEIALAGLQVPCPFQQHGCAEMVPYASEQAHKASCVHAPCHCPISGCAGYAGGKPLREHLQQDHPEVVRTAISPTPGSLMQPLWLRPHEKAHVVRLRHGNRNRNGNGNGGAEFLLVIGEYKQLRRALSVVHLVDENVDQQDFKFSIEVSGKAGVLSLSGATPAAERLLKPYEAKPFLFIPNEDWESTEDYFRVFIKLK